MTIDPADRLLEHVITSHVPAGAPRSLVLLEDHADLAFLLSRAIERSEVFDLIGHAADLRAAEALLDRVTPEVVVVDARLPGQSDLVLVPLARKSCPRAVVVVLTALSSERMTLEAHVAGADFVLEKNKAPSLLVADIAELLVG